MAPRIEELIENPKDISYNCIFGGEKHCEVHFPK